MARPRTATAQLDARGAFLKHPERKRARSSEPQPEVQLGEPPKRLSRAEKTVWSELSAKMPPGVAFDSDEAAFEVLVCLVANFRHRQKQNLAQVVGEISQMTALFGKFGLTPGDRSKVQARAPEEPVDDPWARIQQPPAQKPI